MPSNDPYIRDLKIAWCFRVTLYAVTMVILVIVLAGCNGMRNTDLSLDISAKTAPVMESDGSIQTRKDQPLGGSLEKSDSSLRKPPA
jgi:hypothetical protein